MNKMIGKRIQEYRKAKGLTQEELAERVDISPHYLSALERGCYNIKLELLVAILNALECSADAVFCDVVKRSAEVKTTELASKMKHLSFAEQKKILEVVDTMIKNASN